MSKIFKLSIVVMLGVLFSYCNKADMNDKEFVFKGKVVDHASNEPVEGMWISISKMEDKRDYPEKLGECVTNAQGEYIVKISCLEPDTYDFEIVPRIDESDEYNHAINFGMEKIEYENHFEVTQNFELENSAN